MQRPKTFDEFWPIYVRFHSKIGTRNIHFAGTTAVVTLIIMAVLTGQWWYLFLTPIAGYGCAWYSHFFVEKNKPAAFNFPWWSLKADFKMWVHMLRGEMDKEVEEAFKDRADQVA